jgi:hypothetical protein
MERIPLTEAATLAGLTRDKARYWSGVLELPITKQGRVSYLPAGADRLLSAMRIAVDGGMSPATAAVEVKSVHSLPVEKNAPICAIESNTSARLADLEKAVMLLVEQNKHLSDGNKFLTDLVQAQAVKIDTLSAKLLPPPANTKPVEVWQPCRRSAPKVSWFRRAWLELFDPVQLRATP